MKIRISMFATIAIWFAATSISAQSDRNQIDSSQRAPQLVNEDSKENVPSSPFVNLSLDQALVLATKENKVILIDFFTSWCSPCKLLDQTTWKNEQVIKLLNEKAVTLKINAEKEVSLSKRYKVGSYPTLLILKADGSVVDRIVGYQNAETFLISFQSALKGITALERARAKVASTVTGDLELHVNARHALAQVLAQQSLNEEALKEYLWLYNEGMPQTSHVVKNSYLLTNIIKLAKVYPPAREVMVQRRNILKQQSFSSEDGRQLASDFISLNEALGEETISLEVFDKLTPNSQGRKTLGIMMWEQLIKQKRYLDAAECKPLNEILATLTKWESQPQGLKLSPMMLEAIRSGNYKLAANGIEALAGAGKLEDAKTLINKAIAMDNSTKAKEILETHIRRANQTALLDVLH